MEVKYEYYMSEFGGEEIPEEKFKRISKLAKTYLEQFTHNRVKDDTKNTEKVKDCVCEMCETIYLTMYKNEGAEKKSESTDGYSVSYVTEQQDGEDKNVMLQKKLYRIARNYLANTGPLYLGV